MSDPDQPRQDVKSRADQTLLGVAPPRTESSSSRPHSPVLVRSGTSIADVEPALLPSSALAGGSFEVPSGTAAAMLGEPSASASSASRARFDAAFAYVRARPLLWMIVIPVLCSLGLIALLRHPARGRPVTGRAALSPSPVSASSPSAAPAAPQAAALDELERRPASSLSASELVLLAQGRAQQKRDAAGALRAKLERDPALGNDSATQKELLRLTADESTAPDALAALAALETPTGGDLLYDVWTGTTVRTNTTELARALLYSTDVRPKVSRALSVALDLRVAETCEQYQAVLPKALTDGDRRALHLLTKLNGKRGCGAKKTDDCYACLRANGTQLVAAIIAAKGRRAPSVSAQ